MQATSCCSATGGSGCSTGGSSGRLDADTHRFFVRVIEGALGDEDAWDDVSAHLVKTYGPAIRDAMGLERRAALRLRPRPRRAGAHPAVRRGEPRRSPHRPADPDGPGPRTAGARGSVRSVISKAEGTAPASAHNGGVRRNGLRVRPGHVPARQATHVLRALRQDVHVRHPDPLRSRRSSSRS